MKRQLLAICMLLTLGVSAQVTITQNEMPHSGDSLYRTRAAVNPFLNYAATGTNYIWNFTNLTATTQDSAIYQTVASTNFVYALTYIDLVFNPNRANHAKPGVDIAFNNLLPVTNPYTFNYRSASIYKTVGFGLELAGIPVPVIFTNHDEIYNLPINYGDADSSFSSYNLSLPTLAYYGYEQSRMNEVDGWGIINTPAGSFDALRVKTTLHGKDTINIDTLSLGFSIDRPVIHEYKWLSTGFRIPIMQVNTTELFGIEIITDIFFYDLPRTINVVQPLAATLCPGSTVVVPYDITGTFNAGGIFVPGNIFRAQLSDMNGDFTNAVNIGSVTSTTSGTISCTIPVNTPPGTGYRIRVIATNPAFIGNDNGFDITVLSLPSAVATAGGPTEFCIGGAVLLSATTDPTYSYQWQLNGNDLVSETNSDHNAISDGSYTVVVTNGCGSTTSTPIVVIVNPLPEHIFSQAVYGICDNSQVTLTAQNTSGQGPLNYQWFADGNLMTGETNDNLTTGTVGSYTLEITNPVTGCIFSTTVDVIVDSVITPLISTSGGLTICAGDSVVMDVPAVAGTTYQWQLNGTDISGAGSNSYTAVAAGTYTVVATSIGGCTAASVAGVDVIINPAPQIPIITASGNTVFCSGGTVQLDILPEPGVTYQWLLNGNSIPGATGNFIVAADSGNYSVIATGGTGCISTSSLPGFAVQVNPLPAAPVINTSGATSFCEGDSVVLSVIAVIGFNYQWTLNSANIPGAIYNQITVTDSTGSYSVFVTDMNGCSSAATISYQVNVNPLPAIPVITQVNDTLYTSGSGNFQWYLDGSIIPGATGPYYVPVLNGNYTVTVSDVNGCSSIAVDFPVTNVGISESGELVFQLYPNPSSGTFQLVFAGNKGAENTIHIFDPAGKEIFSAVTGESKYLMDLSEFADGIYILKIQQQYGMVSVTKLIKQ